MHVDIGMSAWLHWVVISDQQCRQSTHHITRHVKQNSSVLSVSCMQLTCPIRASCMLDIDVKDVVYAKV